MNLILVLEEDPGTRAVKQEMYNSLKARKDALEEMLKQKTELLKALCIQEGVSYHQNFYKV